MAARWAGTTCRAGAAGQAAMTLDKARELLSVQVNLAGGYNRNSARLILAEVQHEHGQAAVDMLIREFDLEAVFGFKPGAPVKA